MKFKFSNYSKKGYFLICFLMMSAVFANAQIKIESCGINAVIPKFNADSDMSYDSQFPVKIGFIKNIKESKSYIEIRYYVYEVIHEVGDVVIFKCDGDSITCENYRWVYIPENKGLDNSNFKIVMRDSLSNMFLYLRRDQKYLEEGMNWNSFFQRLIDSHLFSIPTEKDILKKYGINNFRYSQNVAYEIKIGDRFRNLFYGTDYSDLPDKNKFREYLFKIVYDNAFEHLKFNFKQ